MKPSLNQKQQQQQQRKLFSFQLARKVDKDKPASDIVDDAKAKKNNIAVEKTTKNENTKNNFQQLTLKTARASASSSSVHQQQQDRSLCNVKSSGAKFGKFMGKLLLVKDRPAENEPAAAQPDLTGYFRVQKPLNPPGKITIKLGGSGSDEADDDDDHDNKRATTVAEEQKLGKDVTTIKKDDSCLGNTESQNKQGQQEMNISAHEHGPISKQPEKEPSSVPEAAETTKSVCDTHVTSISSLTIETPKVEATSDDDDEDEGELFDDLSSLSSLQSDDDVLGPWSRAPALDHGHQDPPEHCSECDNERKDVDGPFEQVGLCNRCQSIWGYHSSSWLSRISILSDKGKSTSTCSKSSKRRPIHRRINKAGRSNTKLSAVPPPKNGRSVNRKKQQVKQENVGQEEEEEASDQVVEFDPNPYGFTFGAQVQVLNINGLWYQGTLTMMHAGKVKVRYTDWLDQEEWFIMGSRRIKLLQEGQENDIEQPRKTEQRETSVIPALLTPARTLAKDDDYLSAVIDKDPTQIFNDNEVYLTRRMARELADEHGFRINAYGYRHNRAVAVTFKNSHLAKAKEEVLGYLREMRRDQIRVWCPTLRQSEWLPMGSRRLRLLTDQEEAALSKNTQFVPPSIDAEQQGSKNVPDPTRPPKTMTATAAANRQSSASKKQLITVLSSKQKAKSSSSGSAVVASEKTSKTCIQSFKTTGAFATRRAMSQLKDEYGFAPNPYGYTYNQPVEILNTRTAKTKFWDRGRLIAMRPGEVKVRYDGWGEIYDEWLKVGSRRIRIVSPEEENNTNSTEEHGATVTTSSTSAAEGSSAQLTSSSAALFTSTTAGLLVTENNPELKDEAKKKKKRRVLGPEDYLQLGYVVSLDNPPPQKRRGRPPKKQEATLANKGDDDKQIEEAESAKVELPGKKRSRAAARSRKKQGRKKQRTSSNNGGAGQQSSTNSMSRRPASGPSPTSSAGVKAAEPLPFSLRSDLTHNDKHGFIANEYGYDYMQHVQVLHLDKKWYEGRLVHMDRNRVHVHYCGWIDKFDEYIPVGSRRLQVIENDHEVECVEPGYQQRYEESLQQQQQEQEQQQTALDTATEEALSARTLRSLRRRELGAGWNEEPVEYHKENENENDADVEVIDKWKVYCNQCNVVIKQFRYYCTYCETPSEGTDYRSFELCLQCFDQSFPFWHDHPRSSFAVQAVIDSQVGPMPIKGELVTVWEEDVMDTTAAATTTNDEQQEPGKEKNQQQEMDDENVTIEASQIFSGQSIENLHEGYKYLKRWQRRKVCAFCNDDDDTSEELGKFIGPFVIATYNKNGVERKRQFWAHDSCARYSPEVFCTPEGKWYNVTLALRRGRGMRCYACKEKGATIGCFDSRCTKSFHLPCSQKPVSYFRNGVIFWCSTHEAYYNKKDTYVNIFKCDGCGKKLEDESWFSCVPCASSYFSSFDLCTECFEKFPSDHAHDADSFEETSFEIIKEVEAQKAREAAQAKEQAQAKRKKPLFPKRRRLENGALTTACCYCGTHDATEWRKGYDGGVVMCQKCFEVALSVDSNDGSNNEPLVMYGDDQQQDHYVTSIEDYTHKPYLTREALSATKFSKDSGQAIRLSSYEPQPNQLFSLVFDSTYFDIPGRAPRWATHSGTDYHGTWLPQTVRRAILKYTQKDERVLSNFLGRGTDAIECFLLQRRCCGVDINPAAVALSQRNCCFEIPPGLTSAEYRPIIAQADSRHLSGSLFADESFHHILSHPPYKDCVAYSTHLEGDLSRFTTIDEFKQEYIKVVRESWRLLQMGRRLTLGIGDNREHCFYVPVGFNLLRQYIDEGFELEELIIKRQRYCSAFGLGTYLCVQYDFLVFTHEFIATFRKIPKENVNRMISTEDIPCNDHIRVTRVARGVPTAAVSRKSVVMGTVWVFRPTEKLKFHDLCLSRMVERFGQDETNWEHIVLDFMTVQEPASSTQETLSEKTAEESETTTTNSDNTTDANEKDDAPELSEYEQQRLARIEENTRTLLKLGLISELGEDSTDVIHYEAMMSRDPLPDAPLKLMVVHHQPQLLAHQIGLYRETLIQIAHEAAKKLAPQGHLILGVQDIRTEEGKLWPLGMLVLEDIERAIPSDILKLKEMVIAVPDGYSKVRNQQVPEENTIPEGHLPIVHATYLVFQKL